MKLKLEPVALLVALGSVSIAFGLRASSLLQATELWAYDLLFSRSEAVCEAPVTIVWATEKDLQEYSYPIPGSTLATLVETLQSYEPAAIGLDMYRDIPVEPGHSELLQKLEAENTVALHFVNPGGVPVQAPPGAANKGSADVVVDRMLLSDEDELVVRRALIATGEPFGPSLGLAVSAMYLNMPWWDLLDKTETFWVETYGTGPYQRVDSGGYQILLNWRSCTFTSYSFAEALSGKNLEIEKDSIVLIGYEAPSIKDIFASPVGLVPGIEYQAEVAAQLVDIADDMGSAVTYPNELVIWAGTIVISSTHSILIFGFRKKLAMMLPLSLCVTVILIGASVGIYYYAFVPHSLWLPIIPLVVVLSGNFVCCTALAYALKMKEQNRYLGDEVERRTGQLVRERIFFEIGKFANGISHQMEMPLSIAENTQASIYKALTGGAYSETDILNKLGGLEEAINAAHMVNSAVRRAVNPSETLSFEGSLQSSLNRTIEMAVNIIEASEVDSSGQLAYRYCLDDSLPQVKIGQGELLRVLLNLIYYAGKLLQGRMATEPGFQGIIELCTHRVEGGAWLKIGNNGFGIPELVRMSLEEEPFSSSQEVETSEICLDLQIVAEIIKVNDGCLCCGRAGSGDDMGTTFSVFLPTR